MVHQIHIVLHFEAISEPVELLGFGRILWQGLTNEVLTYGAPNPTLVNFKSRLDGLEGKITAWGTPPNHGTSTDLSALTDSMVLVKQDMRDLAHYCENTTPNNGTKFTACGWHISHAASPVGMLPGPANLHRVLPQNRTLIQGQNRFRWNPVHGASAYKVWTGTGAIISLPPDPSLPYDTVTATAFTDHAPSGTSRFIVVGCVGAEGTTGYTGLSGIYIP